MCKQGIFSPILLLHWPPGYWTWSSPVLNHPVFSADIVDMAYLEKFGIALFLVGFALLTISLFLPRNMLVGASIKELEGSMLKLRLLVMKPIQVIPFCWLNRFGKFYRVTTDVSLFAGLALLSLTLFL